MTAYRIAPHVAWVDDEVLPRPYGPEPQVYIADLPEGRPLVLSGSSWAIWSAVARWQDPADIIAAVAAELDVPPSGELKGEVCRFLEQLADRGLLERVQGRD